MFRNLRLASKFFPILPKTALFGKMKRLFEGYGTGLLSSLVSVRPRIGKLLSTGLKQQLNITDTECCAIN